MQIPTPPTPGTLTKWDWGGAPASARLTRSPGGSGAGSPRIAHLDSLVIERDACFKPPGADTLLLGSWNCRSFFPPWGPFGRSHIPVGSGPLPTH